MNAKPYSVILSWEEGSKSGTVYTYVRQEHYREKGTAIARARSLRENPNLGPQCENIDIDVCGPDVGPTLTREQVRENVARLREIMAGFAPPVKVT